ncbi:putative uncharacterized protein DDB_G0291786 [Gordionus sp. m RMFG-2023]|uniref:putative uncharacterized protein DDB_G0291786 n=1 Tax=Gordionus sp. m RMFG-2023 TaxID=3053472 RepID=UPI0031FDA826
MVEDSNNNIKVLLKTRDLKFIAENITDEPTKKYKLFETINKDLAVSIMDSIDNLSYEQIKDLIQKKVEKNKITRIMEVFSTKPDRLESSREYLDRLKVCGSGLNSELIAVQFIINCHNERLKTRLVEENTTDLIIIEEIIVKCQSLEFNNKKSFIEKDTWRIDDRYGAQFYTSWNENKHNGRTYNNKNNNYNDNNNNNNNLKKQEIIQTPYNLRPRNKINFINDFMINMQLNNLNFSF